MPQQGATLTDVGDSVTIEIPESENSAVAIQLVGASATCVVEATVDDATFVVINAYNPVDDVTEATLVSPGIWRVEAVGYTKLRVRKTVGTADTRATLVARRG